MSDEKYCENCQGCFYCEYPNETLCELCRCINELPKKKEVPESEVEERCILKALNGEETLMEKFQEGFPPPDAIQPGPSMLSVNGKFMPSKNFYRLKEIKRLRIFIYEEKPE